MKTRLPLYLLDSGIEFSIKKESYIFIGVADNGMIEARDKFGLLVEFNPSIAVIVK